MNDIPDPDTREPDLPPDLEELHRTLSDLRIEERASFGPELEAELDRAWVRRRATSGAGGRRIGPAWTVAAAAVVLFVVTAPPARAAFTRFLEGVVDVTRSETVEETDHPIAEPMPMSATDRDSGSAASDPSDAAALRVDLPTVSTGADRSGDGAAEDGTTGARRNALPGLLDRGAAEELIRAAYPEELQRRGVGGTVRLLLYVEPSGEPDHIRVRRGSGVERLDRAAVSAAGRFAFSPAIHDGLAVGQWVEFNVRFEVPRRNPSLSDLYLVPAGTSPGDAAELGLLDARLVRNVWRTPGRGELGVFYQLHDLPEGRHDLEVRVVLEDVRTGARTRLRLHPQDEGPFRPTWNRVAVGPGSARDYVIVDFRDVERGEYVLRVETVLTGSERVVESARRLRVR